MSDEKTLMEVIAHKREILSQMGRLGARGYELVKSETLNKAPAELELYIEQDILQKCYDMLAMYQAYTLFVLEGRAAEFSMSLDDKKGLFMLQTILKKSNNTTTVRTFEILNKLAIEFELPNEVQIDY